jgi:hypothetical protein
VLKVLTREDLTQGFLIHESSTLSTIWAAQPCFNGLVTFEPMQPWRASTPSFPIWRRSDRGRTAIATSSSSCGAALSGTTASR